MSHTNELLKVKEIERYGIAEYALVDSSGNRIVDTIGSDFGLIIENRANAERLATCWNACVGYANPQELADVLAKVGVAIADAERFADKPATAFDANILWADLMEVKKAIHALKGGA